MSVDTPNYRAVVAANIRALLAWKHLSGRDLSDLVGMKQTTMSAKLRGRSEFTIDELDAIARTLGMPDPTGLFRTPESYGEPFEFDAA